MNNTQYSENERFEKLILQLQEKIRKNPKAYQLKVFMLAILGNLYIGIMILFLLSLIPLLLMSILFLKAFAIKLILIVGFFIWVILRSLWVKQMPPQGYAITATDAPELFEIIHKLQQQLNAPDFHKVLIVEDLNAGVVQIPRFLGLGSSQNYLLLGLPLLKSLTVAQFTAVLAHEFGHLAKNHAQFSNWIYRQRIRWTQLVEVLEQNQSRGDFLFRPFLNRFVPYFTAYSFPLAQANEYEADAIAVQLTSSQSTAEALTTVSIISQYLDEKYWTEIYKHADDMPQPVMTPFFNLTHALTHELEKENTTAWLSVSMQQMTTHLDTHPSLQDRLKAIGVVPEFKYPSAEQRADRLLGKQLEKVTANFDQMWQSNISSSWQERYQFIQGGKQRLIELDQKQQSDDLNIDEAFERAQLTLFIAKQTEQACQQLAALHEKAPEHAEICLEYGRALLEKNDDQGCVYMIRAAELNEFMKTTCYERLRDFYWQQGQPDQAQHYHHLLVERLELESLAQQERNQLHLNNKFTPHDLSSIELQQLTDALSKIKDLKKAYFVKKKVDYLTHLPCYVLAFSTTRWYQFTNKKRIEDVLQQIQNNMPLNQAVLILSIEGDNYKFGRKMRWIKGSRIF